MRMAPPDQYRYVVVRFHPGNDEEQAGFIEDVWKRNYPNYAFDAFWHKDRMMQEYATNDAIRLVFLYIGIIVVIISSMGLLALVSLNIARRTREIGIRKALGASAGNIGKLIVREFVILTCIGSVLAAGMGYFLTDSLLSSIWRYYTDFGVFPFVLSTVIVVGVGIAAVGYRVYAAARSNPVEALKCE
jgi:ABC-type antimicrobial peptide transport system permease subunit